MRSRRPTPEHQEAVSRRLALLSAELSAVRPAAPGPPPGDDEDPPWWDEHTRVALPRVPTSAVTSSAPPLPPPAPPPVPVPGRHAARRRRPPLVPETLRGRVLVGAPQLAVLAIVVSVGLAVTAWWVVRSDPEPVGDLVAGPAGPIVPVPSASLPSPAVETDGDAAAPGADGPATVTVDVAGKVRRPGIAVLGAGSRVVDAIAAAGGVRAGVDTSGLNLARVLVDGEQVLVGVDPPPGVAASAGSSAAAGAGGAPAALVDLNTADEAALDSLPEVGPVTAAAILAWRDEHGGFTSVDELLEVDGIGEATLARIAPHVTV